MVLNFLQSMFLCSTQSPHTQLLLPSIFFHLAFGFFSVDLLDHLDTKQILYVACACVVFRPDQCLVLESIECVFVICMFGLTKQQLGVHGHL